MKVHYACKKYAQGCPAAILLLYHSEKVSVSLFRTADEHDHSNVTGPTRGLDPETRRAVAELYGGGMYIAALLIGIFMEANSLWVNIQKIFQNC